MKTFLLCVGAERCGTTWLYKYLENYDSVDFGETKEYHYFDSLNIDEYKNYVRINKKHDILSTFYDNENNYFNYFINILNKKMITGDISPGYSALDKNILNNIKLKFLENKINTKVLYLIRNPVDRHISATNLRISYDHLSLNNNEYNNIILSNMTNSFFKINSNYEQSHNKLLDIFKDQYLLKKYDSLFTYESTKEITNFLNLKYEDYDFKTKVHSKEISDLTVYKSTIEKLNDFYKNEITFFNSIN